MRAVGDFCSDGSEGSAGSVVCVTPATAQDVGAASVLPADVGISGGLCVQVGAADLATAAELAGNGRFLVQVLDADAAAVDRARLALQTQGLYGLASVDRLTSPGKLPYAENLVNLLLLADGSAGGKISAAEAARVLCPHGIVIVREDAVSQAELEAAGLQDVRSIETSGRWRLARKPWPAEMDSWSHPRHGADGNAVSADALVGPPRRVRWVAGPPQEVSNLVTAAGRNFLRGGAGA